MGDGVWVIDRNLGINESVNPTTLGEAGYVLQSLNTGDLTEGVVSVRMGTQNPSRTLGLTGDIKWCGRFVPNTDTEELWGASNNAGTAELRRVVGASTTVVAYSDTVAVADLLYHHSATLNGKFYLAYNSDVNRLHVWDGTALRRVGLIKPSAPTVADTGAGAYAATARNYRVAFRIKSGTDIVAQSELSAAVSFTPSGGGTAARVTKPTTVDSATHWVVFGLLGSVGDVYDLYEELSEIVVGTTTYDDSTAPASYDGNFPPELGVNIPPPSCKFLATDGAHLFMSNAWETSGAAGETTPKVNRVWFTRALGASDIGDEESAPNSATLKYYVDVGDGGPTTGLAGPIYGEVYVFKKRSIWKLVATGDVTIPFRAVLVSRTVGTIDQRLIADMGDAGIAFADETHVYQVAANQTPVVISEGIAIALRFSVLGIGSWLAYDQTVATLYVMTGEASGYTLAQGRWRSVTFADSVVFNRGVMTAPGSGEQKLVFVGKTSGGTALHRVIGVSAGQDGPTAVAATVRVRRAPAPGCLLEVFPPTIWYRSPLAAAPSSLTVTYQRHDGQSSPSVTISLTDTASAAAASGTTYQVGSVTVDGLYLTDARVIDATFALTVAAADTPSSATKPLTIDRVDIPYVEHPVVTR